MSFAGVCSLSTTIPQLDRPAGLLSADGTEEVSAGQVDICSERRVLIGAVLVSAVVFSCSLTLADPDLWGHTLYGLRAIDQGVLTERFDPFSYTAAGASWVNHEWLAEYQFGWLWKTFGAIGLSTWRNLAVLIVFLVAAWSIRASRASVASAVLLLVLSAECLSDFVVFVRPQLATFALFAVTLAILSRHWERPDIRSLWLLPLLMAAWVNLHGGFLAGLGMIGLFTAGWMVRAYKNRGEWRAARRMMVVCGLAVGATLINPYGVELQRMLWHHLWTTQSVREWQALWQTSQSPVYYVPFLLVGIAFAASRRWRWIDLAVMIVVGWQAVSHLRHIALLCIAAMVLLPGPLSDGLDRLFPHIRRQFAGREHRWKRVAAVVSVVVFLAVLQIRGSAELWKAGVAPWNIGVETRSQVPGMPLAAVELLKQEQFSGNLVTDYGWGQFVIWHLHPRIAVAFDGRYRTIYPADVEREFMAFHERNSTGKGSTEPIIDTFPTEIALLPVKGAAARRLAERSDWVELYRDEQAVLFVAELPKFAELIERFQNGELRLEMGEKWAQFPGGSVGTRAAIPVSATSGSVNSRTNGTVYAMPESDR